MVNMVARYANDAFFAKIYTKNNRGGTINYKIASGLKTKLDHKHYLRRKIIYYSMADKNKMMGLKESRK